MDWQPIETAPRDGALVDLLCGDPAGVSNISIRLTDCAWHEADEIFPHTGWVRICDDGSWDLVEADATCQFGLPAWKAEHWMPLPEPPKEGS